ncbi:MAG: MBL fold metallo-hydrolase [Gemmatimonadales bacterium]|nr:MAG: MBL fold metallo-hydrolase [Gemmatimonadales bacterium]
MLFRQFFDPKLAQYAYLVGCQQTGEAVIIDPERDIDRYVEAAESEGLRIVAVAETHIHADFLSGAREFAHQYGTRTYLSDEGGADWASDWARTGEYDVTFLKDGDAFHIGGIEIQALHTPGHTPEHISFVLIDRGGGASTPIGVATGDFVFVGDLGRPDLLEQAAGMHGVQEPSARQLFSSLPRFTELQDYVQVWPAHGAGSTCGKDLGAVPQTTVGYEKLYNASLSAADMGEDAFVDAILAGQPEPQTYFARMKRDNNKGVPLLGQLPSPRRLTVAELQRRVDADETLFLDTRLDRSGFMAKHIPGALYTPMNRAFNTAVGSLVEDETQAIVLIIEESAVEEAVRDLVRLGYDNIAGFVTPETLTRYFDKGGKAGKVEEVGFEAVAEARIRGDMEVVDVRFAAEYAGAHIPGALSASYTRLPSLAPERLPKDRTLLVHCGTGARAAAATAFLVREGYDVRFVNGSFDAYKEDGEIATGSFKGEPQEPAAV